MVIFDGKDLSEFGVSAIGRGTYGSPARDVETVHVPGRNGDVIFDNGCFYNAEITYPDCSIDDRFPERFRALRNFLMRDSKYRRLEDDYNPDEYRMARFTGAISPDVHTARNNRSGVFTLTFDAQPQRWLRSGEDIIEVPVWQPNSNKARCRFTKTNVEHSVVIGINSASVSVTVTYGSTTQTLSGATEYELTMPAGTYLFDVSVSASFLWLDIRYERTNVRIKGANALQQKATYGNYNEGDFTANPLLQIIPGASTIDVYVRDADTLAGNMSEAGTPMTITASTPSQVYYIDSQDMTAKKAAAGSPYKTDCTEEMSGEMPVLPVDSVGIYVAGATDSTRVQLIPRSWRI